METAWKCTHVPKPVPNLCTACAQAWTLLVHWSYCLVTPCTLEVYTCLGTGLGTGLGTCVHFQAVFKLGHSNFYSSAHVAHISSLKWCYRSNKLHASYILPLGWSCKLMLYTRLLCNSPGEGKRKETILKHI